MRLTVDDSVGGFLKDGVYKFVAEGLAYIGRCPQQPDRNALLQETRRTRADTTPSSNEYETAEEGNDAEDTEGGDATDPEFRRRVVDHLAGPVTSARDDEGVSGLAWLGNGGETVPLNKRTAGYTGEGAGDGRDCGEVCQICLIDVSKEKNADHSQSRGGQRASRELLHEQQPCGDGSMGG